MTFQLESHIAENQTLQKGLLKKWLTPLYRQNVFVFVPS